MHLVGKWAQELELAEVASCEFKQGVRKPDLAEVQIARKQGMVATQCHLWVAGDQACVRPACSHVLMLFMKRSIQCLTSQTLGCFHLSSSAAALFLCIALYNERPAVCTFIIPAEFGDGAMQVSSHTRLGALGTLVLHIICVSMRLLRCWCVRAACPAVTCLLAHCIMCAPLRTWPEPRSKAQGKRCPRCMILDGTRTVRLDSDGSEASEGE